MSKSSPIQPKVKRMPDHPMKERMNRDTKRRIQRSSFLKENRKLEDLSPELEDMFPKELPRTRATPELQNKTMPIIRISIPGIGPKSSQDPFIRKSVTMEHLENSYPSSDWAQVYTDGSAEKAIRNGRAGIFIKCPDRQEHRHQRPTGAHSTNYK